ncbi:MAG: LysR family transcriptional regulator [Hyphomonadaceae bacterium]|nr:LysR family transcriptional regulator [Hyphomonadaceae bacterium]MBC6411919.1 LysR family transcriptional regulator [Hyphomonadaceae bacterium]
MELRQLRYLIAVAEEENFGRAALKLNISQPPVTRQIKKLEEELGVQLFKRTQKGAALTAAGGVFLGDARQIMSLVHRSVERVEAAHRGELGTAEVAYFGSPSLKIVPEILQVFKNDYPDVEINLRRIPKREQIRAIKVGEIHMGFGRYFPHDPDIYTEEILTEGLAVAVPKYLDIDIHASNWKKIFKSASFVLFPAAGRPNFADEVLSILNREGIDPQIGNVTEDIHSALILTAVGEGFTITPSSVADLNWSGVKFFELPEFGMACPLNCIFRKSDTSPILRALRTSIRRHFQKPGEGMK